MNKVASYKEIIYKEASTKLSRPDLSKAKTIHAKMGEYAVRDAKLGEKVMYGAETAYKAGKKGIKEGAKLIKTNPTAKKIALGMAGTQVAAHAMLKATDKQREKNVERNYHRDTLAPDTARQLKSIPLRAGSLAAAYALGGKGMKAGEHIARRAIIKGGIKGVDKAEKIMSKGRAIGAYAGMMAPIAGGVVAEHKMTKKDAHKRLDKLSEKHLGRKGTEGEHAKIERAYGKNPFVPKTSMVTPESEVQRVRRQKERVKKRAEEKRNMKKRASEELNVLAKEAKEKWTKQDKKGYIRNVAISTAQDFMNAGNPLNVGSSIVGSVLDSAILEKASLNLNKKLKANTVSKEKVDGFNKAVEVKNGTALPHAINKAK